MIRYTVEQAQREFGELLAHVQAGEEVEVISGTEVVPLRRGTPMGGLGCMEGRIEIRGDIVAPPDEPWDALR